MKRYMLSYFKTAKIEKIYINMPSQLAKKNKKFQYGKIEKSTRSE